MNSIFAEHHKNFTLTPARQQKKKKPRLEYPGLMFYVCHYGDKLFGSTRRKRNVLISGWLEMWREKHATFLSSSYWMLLLVRERLSQLLKMIALPGELKKRCTCGANDTHRRRLK